MSHQTARRGSRPPKPRRRVALALGAAALTAGSLVATASAAAAGTGSGGGARYVAHPGSLVLTRVASNSAPGYQIVIHTNPFEVTTIRDGQTVLATTGSSSTAAAARFVAGGKSYFATKVMSEQWRGGSLMLRLATTDPGAHVAYTLTPGRDRYRIHWRVDGDKRVVSSVGGDYSIASAGHWYGEGIVENDHGAPYNHQPWPLSSGSVNDDEVGPFSYFIHNPFWYTSSSTGLWVDTFKVMNVQINEHGNDRASFLVTNSTRSNDGDIGAPAALGQSRRYRATVFVETTPRAVYQDYIGIAGHSLKSDTKPYQYRTPLWDNWGDLHLRVTQASFLNYAKTIHDARLPANTMELDDGWSAGYSDHAFNLPKKFPHPKAMVAQIHKLGYKFALWDTFQDNRNGDRASVLWPFLDQHGYLLKAVKDPIPFGTHTACAATWFGGGTSDHPGMIDLANPAARAWLKNKLDTLAKHVGIDGWKFDTQIYNPKCKPYPGTTQRADLRIGLNFMDRYNLTGQGMITSAWTGTQRYGFATDDIDKSANWNGLRAAAHQALAISTIGYPFTELDMIGGSDGSNPPKHPTSAVLVRWVQAAALTPLMLGSVNPTRYDKRTVDLYRAAIHLHENLWPYLMQQVHHAVATGEPIEKPIFFNYPNDRKSYTIGDEWLFGNSLLAAPVLRNVTSRNINIPKGTWYDVIRRCVVVGPTDIANYRVTLADVPLFVKLGTGGTGMLLHALAPDARGTTADCAA